MFHSKYIKEEVKNASVLYEVPYKKGDEGPQSYHYEKRKVGYSGYLPGMRNQDV
jgi:hypothetical protein